MLPFSCIPQWHTDCRPWKHTHYLFTTCVDCKLKIATNAMWVVPVRGATRPSSAVASILVTFWQAVDHTAMKRALSFHTTSCEMYSVSLPWHNGRCCPHLNVYGDYCFNSCHIINYPRLTFMHIIMNPSVTMNINYPYLLHICAAVSYLSYFMRESNDNIYESLIIERCSYCKKNNWNKNQ